MVGPILATIPISAAVCFVIGLLIGFPALRVKGLYLALVTLGVLYFSGSTLGVRLPAGEWLRMTGLMLIGLVPFVALGIFLGHVLTAESTGPAIGGITALFALLGGDDPSWLLAAIFVASFGLVCGFVAQRTGRTFLRWATALAGAEIARLAVEMNRYDGFRSRGEGRLQLRRVQAVCRFVHVNQHRSGAAGGYCHRRRDVRVRRNHDLAAGAGCAPNRFYAYGVVARLAQLAAAIEVEELASAETVPA